MIKNNLHFLHYTYFCLPDAENWNPSINFITCERKHPIVTHHLQADYFQVRGDPFAQPDVIPPAGGDQVTEPHVGHLVGHQLRGVVLLVKRRPEAHRHRVFPAKRRQLHFDNSLYSICNGIFFPKLKYFSRERHNNAIKFMATKASTYKFTMSRWHSL